MNNMCIRIFFALIFCELAVAIPQKPDSINIKDIFTGNYLEDQVFSLTEEIDYKNSFLERMHRIDPANNPLPRMKTEYICYLHANGSHFKYNTSDGNPVEIYINNKDVYYIDPASPNRIEIYKAEDKLAKRFFVLENLYLWLFRLPDLRNVSSLKDFSISTRNNKNIITWEYDNLKLNILTFDSRNKSFPKEFESNYLNGNPSEKIRIERIENHIVIYSEIHLDNGELFFKTKSTIKIIENSKFVKNLIPESFGFKEIEDHRSGKVRNYIAFDKLPSEEFINDLYKNPDNVRRYLIEMSKFSPFKCDHCGKIHSELNFDE